jgi:hypothetical protein
MTPVPCEFTEELRAKITKHLKTLPTEKLKNIRQDIEFFKMCQGNILRGYPLTHHEISTFDVRSAAIKTGSKQKIIENLLQCIITTNLVDSNDGKNLNGFWLDKSGFLKIFI